MKKRIISLLVAATMLLGLMPILGVSVAATNETMTYASPLNGWTYKFDIASNQPAELEDGVNRIVRVANGVSTSGEKSLYIKYNSESDTQMWGNYTAYKNSMSIKNSGLPGGSANAYSGETYNISVNMKNNTNNYLIFRIGGEKVTTVGMTKSDGNLTAEQIADGWQNYSGSITTKSGNTEEFKIVAQMELECYLDDICVYLSTDESKTNLLVGGNLDDEPTFAEPADKWSVAYQTAGPKDGINRIAQIADGVSVSGNKSLYVKYKSPETENSWGGYEHCLMVKNTGLPGGKDNPADGSTYKVSFYMKDVRKINGKYIRTQFGGMKLAATAMTVSNGDLTADQISDGWKYYEGNISTTAGSEEEFKIIAQMDLECYIDDIAVIRVGDETNTNLINDYTFEGTAVTPDPDPEPEPEPTPDAVYTDGVKGWYLSDPIGNSTVNTNKLQTVTGMGYDSDTCMYFEYDTEGAENQYGYSTGDAIVLYNDNAEIDKNKTYTVSMWIKGKISYTTTAYIWMGDTNGSTSSATANKFQFNKFLSGGYSNVDLSEWTQIKATITNPEKQFALRFQCDVPGLYIDDVSLVANDDATKTNLLVNGDMEEMYQQEWDTVYTEDFEGWTVSYNKTDASGNAETDNNSTRMVRIANGLAGKDYRSMMIAYDTDRVKDENSWGGASATWDKYENSVYVTSDTTIEANKNYVVSFMVKPMDVEYLTVNIGNCTPKNYEGMENLTSELSKEKQDEGWRKYRYTFTATKDQGLRFIVNWKSVWYIDDISVVAEGDESNTNLLSPKQSNFEMPNEDGFYAYKANIYDAEDNLITKLTTAQSGATLTAVATVMNYSCEDDYTAQLITCVYNNECLVKTAMSPRTEIPAVGEKVLLQNEIKLPEFTEVGNLSVRTYIWDSVKGMIPLQEEVGEI